MFYSLPLLLFLNGGCGLWARAGIERERGVGMRQQWVPQFERERERGTEILGTVLWLTKFRLCGHIRGPLHVTPDPVHLPTLSRTIPIPIPILKSDWTCTWKILLLAHIHYICIIIRLLPKWKVPFFLSFFASFYFSFPFTIGIYCRADSCPSLSSLHQTHLPGYPWMWKKGSVYQS